MKLSTEELSTGTLSPETIQLAADQVRINGYVVIERVLSKQKIQRLHEKFMETLEEYISKHELNRGVNRTQMHLPFVEPFIDSDVIANPYALPVIEAMVGQNCACRYFASDTALPGSDYQDVHSDSQALFPNASATVPPTGIVLNIPLVDFTEVNGPVEIWPGGTHLILEKDNQAAKIQAVAPGMQSIRVLMPAGSLLIRDIRMWHRGTPNRSHAARPNLALVYYREWFNPPRPRISISNQTYESLSERARKLFRFEDLGK